MAEENQQNWFVRFFLPICGHNFGLLSSEIHDSQAELDVLVHDLRVADPSSVEAIRKELAIDDVVQRHSIVVLRKKGEKLAFKYSKHLIY